MARHKLFKSEPTQVYRRPTKFLTTKLELNMKKRLFSKPALNFYKKESIISLPFAQEQQQKLSPLKKDLKKDVSLQKLSPPRNNLKCLNNYLKQQSSYTKSQDKRVSNSSNKYFNSGSLGILREKVLGLIKLQKNQSALLLQQFSPIFSLNDFPPTNLQIESESIPKKIQSDKNHKLRLCSQNTKISKSLLIRKQRIASLTPWMRCPELSKKGSEEVALQQKFPSIENTEITRVKNSGLLNEQNHIQINKISLSFKNFRL